MPAARYWRAVSLEAHAGGDLELSALHVYDAGGRVDAGATLTSTFAPSAGALANLQDSDFGTTARFAAAAVSAPAFALRWDFGATVDVYGVRAAGPVEAEFLKSLTLQYSDDGATWGSLAAELGDFIYPGAGAMTATPASVPWIYSAPGEWVNRGVGVLPSATRPIAVSESGLRLAAAPFGTGYIFTSDDAGQNWSQRTDAGSRIWRALAASPDGLRILAASSTYLFASSDGGITWAQQTSAGSRNWAAVAISPDGTKMAAAVSAVGLYTSADAGATWTLRVPDTGSRDWVTLGMSADGVKLVIAANNHFVFASSDSGSSWVRIYPVAGQITSPVVDMSADGSRILVTGGGSGQYIFTSGDGGASWLQGASLQQWVAADISGAGDHLVAVSGGAVLAQSKDGGTTWRETVEPAPHRSVAMSLDGRKVATVTNAGFVRSVTMRDPMFAAPPLRAIQAGTPEFFASSPMPDFTAIKLPDVMPWRDMEFAGNGKVTGTVKEKNTPANTPLRRRVRLVREIDGLQIRETWSDASTGAYEFLGIDERRKYSVISYDYAANYRAVIADSLTPEIMT